jgi:hypothetical protein
MVLLIVFGSMMIMMFLDEERIHVLVITKTWLLLIIIPDELKATILTLTPHKACPPQPNGAFAEYVDVYSPLLSQNTRLHLV